MKVGDYVRTESGYIDKIEGFSGDAVWFENDTILVHKSRMEEWGDKTSPNLIDLIEIGDILEVKSILGNVSKVEVDDEFKLLSGEIVGVITKEQYERAVYRV